jgi:glycosyltransferase involved in cell wall biosynthesis
MKKILIISESLNEGGAAIAAQRVGKVLKKNFIISYLFSDKNTLICKCKNFISRLLLKLFDDRNKTRHSLNIFSSLKFNYNKFDLINMHWIGNETISLREIYKIKKPIVWTLHDMWAFCGSEHFAINNRFKTNYSKRSSLEKGLDINKYLWNMKKKYLDPKKITIIANSKWLAEQAKKSSLMKNFNIHCVYNPIETSFWNRVSKKKACEKLRLNFEKKYIFFGAHGGLNNFRKGGDLFISSLNFLKGLSSEYEIIVLGGYDNYREKINNFYFNFFAFEKDEKKQALYHSASDIAAVSSRQESLPQIAVESILSKLPVVSFDIGGLNEIIRHKKNGYLAKPFNLQDFASGIIFCTKVKKNNLLLARKHILNNFNKDKILNQYSKIIEGILK